MFAVVNKTRRSLPHKILTSFSSLILPSTKQTTLQNKESIFYTFDFLRVSFFPLRHHHTNNRQEVTSSKTSDPWQQLLHSLL